MKETFISEILIRAVRHIRDFKITLSKTEKKHLIITGKNGSGKTSLLEQILLFIRLIALPASGLRDYIGTDNYIDNNETFGLKIEGEGQTAHLGHNMFLFFEARRKPEFEKPESIERLSEYSGKKLLKYLLNQTADRAFALEQKENTAVEEIEDWLGSFTQQLRDIYGDPDLEFKFDRKDFNYYIHQKGKNPVTLSQLPDGFASIIEIIAELLMQVEAKGLKAKDAIGIVLIDEIETHLHIELQKRILPLLTSFFPKIQFIVTTHSPFVLSSIKNAVICDLEKRIVTEDLSGYSSELLVESYFGSDKYSLVLQKDLARYEQLVDKAQLTPEEEIELDDLESALNAIPKYLAEELIVKLQQIKLKQLKFAR